MEEIDKDVVERAINDPNPVMEVLSNLLKSVATEAVGGLAQVLVMLGVDPASMPGQYFAQSMLVAADGVFGTISREDWIECYDAYLRVRKILDENPELRATLMEKKTGTQLAPPADDPLLSGEF